MKRVIRKLDLSSLVPAMALAALFTACGDDSSSDSVDSSLTPVESEIDLVGGKKITCDEKMEGVVAALVNGDFRRCEDGAWVKISREEALKTDEILGYSSSSVKAGSSSSAKIASSSSVKAVSSSSAKVTSSSSAKVVGSSSSGTPAVDPDPVPEIYECPDGSFVEVEEDCPTATTSSSDTPDIDPDVNPGEVPGSNSSSEDDVKPDGYYSNSSNCPEGLTCKYATATTEYLNSTKTYGEILDTRDGQVYKTITIGTQTWMAQNLNYALDPEKVSSMGDYAWSGCYGEGSEDFTEEQVAANCSKYGRLYTWEVAMDKSGCGYGNDCDNSYEGTQGVCPAGWRLPTKEDWQKLVKPMATSVEDDGFYNGAEIELRTVDDWYSSSNKGTNASGFSALPAGGRNNNGYFSNASYFAGFWSASEYDYNSAYLLALDYYSDYARSNNYTKYNAFSVRCVQDSDPAVTPGTDPDVTPGTESSDSSESDESSSPSVTPDPVPGSNSSSSEEVSAEVKPDGYYSNSKNCPAGLTCKYATTTDYLNSTKTYGEILDTRDGQVYKTIKICDKDNKNCQTWMAQNLNYGDVVSWCGGGSGTMEGDCSKYGRRYTWEVAMDKAGCGYGNDCNNRYEGTQGVCPSGWHLPSDAEWRTLFENVGGTGTAGSKLKSSSGWNNNGNGANSFGFAVLPAGDRSNGGYFYDEGDYAFFWSSTENSSSRADIWYFYYSDDTVFNDWDLKDYGFSVRCLRDSDPDVTPGEVPGANSSSSEEDAAGVMPDGYYSNSSKCPAGLTCKYATATTEYLNSTKTYGEILDTRDGQVYKTIEICDKNDENCQTWMAQNLNYDPDPSMDNDAWSGCYGDESANCSKYGRLYTWEVAMDKADCAFNKTCNASLKPATPVRGVCPQGWHLPSHYEFEELINLIDPTFDYNHTDNASSLTAGTFLKALSGWDSNNGTDFYGFSALPGGDRNYYDEFIDAGDYADFWSSGENGSSSAFYLHLGIDGEYVNLYTDAKYYARSVRCLKD